MSAYIGRFAPSPSGPLHAGSLVAALGSWLDARAHGGRWLLRIEDVDGPRTQVGAVDHILRQLSALGLHHDGDVLVQSQRGNVYQHALDALVREGHAFACACSRQMLAAQARALGLDVRPGEERVYLGTCREGLAGKAARAWRVRVGSAEHPILIDWRDRRLGPQRQNVTTEVGDFVLKRADGPWAYQLAVVVDDAAQGVTHVVRGEDLADNTPRQMWLQRLLGLPTPHHLHLPLVRDDQGEKLSKARGARAVDVSNSAVLMAALQTASQSLGLHGLSGATPAQWLSAAVQAWPYRSN